MKTSTTVLMWVVGFILVAGFAFGALGFLKGLGDYAGTGGVLPELAEAFQQELSDRALARGPHPVEGFDAFMLIDTFPGLQPADFDGVASGALGEEGRYSYAGDELTWERTKNEPITSAERTVSRAGWQTLLGALSRRLDMPVETEEDVHAIADAVDISDGERTVLLYYYNPENDTDAQGNIMCSADGLVSVERTLPASQTPVQDTVRLLMDGELTAEEEAAGVTTEFPLEGVSLTGAALDESGVLTLEFADPNAATSGGSCRAGILWRQIRATALQFEKVEDVRFQPEELFQP